MRRLLGRARRSAVEALGGTLAEAPPPSPDAQERPGPPERPDPSAPAGVPVEVVARLLFPGCSERVPPELLRGIAPDGTVRDLRQVRQLLGASDAQNFPSPVAVRFGPEDVAVRDFGRFRLVLDTSDAGVSAGILRRDTWHPHVSAIFERCISRGMTVLDVGANVGWFSMLAAVLTGPGGRVIAVDPSSENCRLVLASSEANGFGHVEVWPFALDRTRGWAQYISHLGSNGGLIPEHPGELAARAAPIVPTFPLDDLVGEDEVVDFVKIDVEGAEHRVVQGGARTLERCRPVVVSELSLEMSRRISGAEPVEFLRWFASRGWSLNVIDGDDGSLRPFTTPEKLVKWWPAPMDGEDLLFLPSS
jgi:FkbM family methyltransferase